MKNVTKMAYLHLFFFLQIDSYSAFFDNGGFSKTDLESKLEQHGVHKVFVSGLALDFCVFYSAMDADHLGKSNLKLYFQNHHLYKNYVKLLSGYETYVIHDATRGISEQGIKEALQQMTNNDIKIINSSELEDVLNSDNAGCNIVINLSMLLSMLGIYLLAK